MEQLKVNHSSKTDSNSRNSEFWHSAETKLLGKKGSKKLFDIASEGGDEAQGALESLFEEVLSKYFTPHFDECIVLSLND